MTSEFIPLSAPCLRGNELKYLSECVETEWVSSAGPFVDRFEKDVARYVGSPHAVACVNGTAALHISLLLSGVGSGDEVLVPTLTFIAPVNAVRYVGAEPVFMDCDDHLNLDPEKLAEFLHEGCAMGATGLVNRKTGRPIRAIVVVHVFGHPANLDPILKLARQYHLRVIEDATESLGSFYKDVDGKKVHTGVQGDFGCFSFNGNKIITSGGGGMIVTSDKKKADMARHLTTQAKEDALYFRHDAVGFNYRLTNVQAAIGVAQMEVLDKFIQTKRKNFGRYQDALSGLDGLSMIVEPSYGTSNYWHYALIVDERRSPWSRDRLMDSLRRAQIESRPVWALCHKQKPYQASCSYRIEKAAKFEAQTLNIPCSIALTDEQIGRVLAVIRR